MAVKAVCKKCGKVEYDSQSINILKALSWTCDDCKAKGGK